MATTHVFIVDTTTFKCHLEYLFAGTGAKDKVIDFNAKPNTALRFMSENNLVKMIADSQRIRKDDYVIFYLQQNISEGIYEGKFYGIFKAKEDLSFLDNNDKDQFLKNELVKSLTFRTLISPYEVYAKGVTEWEALDEIKYIQSPNQMLWSLIYRKLKGNRGNTMITIYESDRLFKLLRDKNNRQTLGGSNFTYDYSTQEIILSNNKKVYTGRKEPLSILKRLARKYSESKAFEDHLQAYIIQNIGRNTNKSLDNCLLDSLPLEWIGNEVSCGVGMQRIDVMLSLLKKDIRVVVSIELKAVEAKTNNVFQIQRYINWLEQYYIPNRVSDIQPALVSKKIEDKGASSYKDIIDTFRDLNKKNNRCLPLKYIEYELNNNNLVFQEQKY
jgi:predicted RNA-binding protein